MIADTAAQAEIVCERRGACGAIVLRRPHALNALTHAMVRAIAAALDDWEQDPAITRVMIMAAPGRAFCAGGDIRLLYEQGRAGDHRGQLAFWRDEYRLNRRIKRYPKPYVALIDGVVMGGGVGVSLHGSHVVAGDNFSFAMPEVGIGFFPDVGATYFLPRLPGHWGRRLALTGERVGPDLAAALGLAHARVPSAQLPPIEQALREGAEVDALLAPFSSPAPRPADESVNAAFAGDSALEILARLKAMDTPEARAAALSMGRKSPMSLSIALRQMQAGASLSFEAAMALEFAIVSRRCRAPDFYEGVRALAIDKDHAPLWSPARLEDIDEAEVDRYFAPLEPDEAL